MSSSKHIPLGLYVHLPWCITKCPYCDFNSHALQRGGTLQRLPEQEYVQALLADLSIDSRLIAGRQVESIFFGGVSSPSLFSAAALEQLLQQCRAMLPISPQAEITLEANPGTVSLAKLRAYRDLGINRISLGVQSFTDTALTALGRIHDGNSARAAIEQILLAGFVNFNVDLMHGLPNQTVGEAMDDLTIAIGYQPPHLSWYELTIEPNTYFYFKPPVLPAELELTAIEEHGTALLQQSGYQNYEVSAFAKPGYRARHNLNYWQFGDYLGIGAGAHSKITEQVAGQYQVTRFWKLASPARYLAAQAQAGFTAQTKQLTSADLTLEFVLNALRLTSGVASASFTQCTGLPLTALEPQLTIARQRGLLVDDHARLQPTTTGRRFLQNVLALWS